MPTFHLVVLAIVQGIMEFLPISSSAHLILAPRILGWADQGPMIDLMAHVGTLVAVILYFHKDVGHMIGGFFDLFRKRMTPGGRLALMLILATPPALVVGAFLYLTGIIDTMRDPVLIAYMNLIFAVPLYLSDRFARSDQSVESFTIRNAFLVGLAQSVALIPGISRSGVTMTAARALGLARDEAARFSMLMSIPLLLAFGAVAGLELAEGNAEASMADGLIVAALSCVTALGAIALLMKLVRRIGFLPFVVYRLALGVFLLATFGLTIGG